MKKNILYSLILLLSFIFSACGSNSKADRSLRDFNDVLVVEGVASSLVVNNLKFATSLPFTKLENQDISIKYTNFKLEIIGCKLKGQPVINPESLILDGAKNSQVSISISGEVEKECKPLGYILKADKELSSGGEKSQIFSEVIIETQLDTNGNPLLDNNITDSNTTPPLNVRFFNVTSSAVITKADTVYPLKVQVIDELQKGVAGLELDVLAFDNTFGEIVSLKVSTDNNGFATFDYKSPVDLTSVDGKSVPITIVLDNKGKRVESTTITLSFNASSVIPNTFAFKNGTNIVVQESLSTKIISIDLIDSDGVGVSGEEVRATTLPVAFGSLSQSTTTTDSAGRAIFTYTAPSNLTAIDNQSESIQFRFTDENDNTIIATVNVEIDLISLVPIKEPLFILANETAKIEITRKNQVEIISVYVVDKDTNVGVEGKIVTLSNIAKGRISSSAATTSLSGLAEFEYTAPENISNISSIDAILSLDENQSVTKNITISFNAQTIEKSDFSLINSNNITISFPKETKEIAVQLVKDGKPQSGETVIAKSILSKYGFIQNVSVTTGTDGYARFTYEAPVELVSGDQSLDLIYIDENGAEVVATVEITITPSIAESDVKFINIKNITVSLAEEIKSITAYVVDNNGVGVANQEVSISAITSATHGSITSASTTETDNSGKATFLYLAPSKNAFKNGSETLTLSLLSNGIKVSDTITISLDEEIDRNIPKPIIFISDVYKNIFITDNRQNVEIEVQVFDENTKTPFTQGNVRVELPFNHIQSGIDVGSFTDYSVPVSSNGIATFNYNGPSDIKSLTEKDVYGEIFKFYYEEDSITEENKVSIQTIYKLINGYIPAKYLLTTSSSDGNKTMGLDTQKNFTMYLKDDQGNLVDSKDIHEINITSKNVVIGQILDGNGSVRPKVEIKDENATTGKSFPLVTNTLSGLLPIEISIKFTNANDDNDTITQLMNVVVFSGPPTAMSISYAGVREDSDNAKYVEKFVLTVTDSYNNAVNTRPFVAVGSMVEYAVDGLNPTDERNETSLRLWHGGLDSLADLTINLDLGSNKAELNTTATTFKYVDYNNDKLVVFGKGFVYDALGKWDILKYTNKSLRLKDDYFGKNRRDLFFAVGHNNRQDLCSNDGTEFIGNMKASNYQLDSTGHAKLEFEYDYHLTGKDIMVWANLEGFQADTKRIGRVGEAKKFTLRGNGFISVPEGGYDIPKESSALVTFKIHHKTAPEWYKNGHFGYSVVGNCGINIIDDSNNYDARNCISEVVYVKLIATAGESGCNVQLAPKSLAVASEFTGSKTFK